MSNTIQLKRSTTAGDVPAGLSPGELAIDIAEGKLYYGDDLGGVSGLIQQMYMSSSGAPPVNPKDSALWYQTDTDLMFVFYSGTWKQTSGLSQDLINVNGDTSGTDIHSNLDDDLHHVWGNGPDERAMILTVKNFIDVVYPVGSHYFSDSAINPGDTIFPDTTWEATGEGRFIASVGTHTDPLGTIGSIPAGDVPTGEYLHRLTEAELPSHTHVVGEQNTKTNTGAGGGDNVVWNTNNPDHHSDPTGANQAHNNVPPGWGMYVWKRIS